MTIPGWAWVGLTIVGCLVLLYALGYALGFDHGLWKHFHR